MTPRRLQRVATVRQRRYVLAALLAATVLVATALLWEVVATVFLAITVAYVLLPVRRRLSHRGASPRIAAAAASLLAFVAVLAVAAPLVIVLYRRREELFALLQRVPETVVLEVAEFTYVVDVSSLVDASQGYLADAAFAVARAAPVLALKLALFAFVLYALLLRPTAPRQAVLSLVPPDYHDVVLALHRRTRETLYAIYVLQAATSFVTFLAALVVFALLGYDAPFAYAVVAAVLQFIPVVGPSLLVVGMGVIDLAFGDPSRGIMVLVVGLVVVGFLPDALVRPKLAERTADLPGSIYFIGFTGGVLSVGPVGFIAGPLAVALVAESVDLLAE